jgi:hypothetical protein
MSDTPREIRRDVEAALATRAELGPDYEEHIAAGLAERVEQLVALRLAETKHDSSLAEKELEADKAVRHQRFVLGIVSLGAGVPITAIAGSVPESGLVGIAIAWAGIVGVNIAHAWGGRRR